MTTTSIPLSDGRSATGEAIPVAGGRVSMVYAQTGAGIIVCGVYAVAAFNAFAILAARVKGRSGPLTTVAELLAGEVVEINELAAARGVVAGMAGRDALARF